jgi:hypothetical protein
MIFGFFFVARDPNVFVADRYGPTERRTIELRKRNRWWRKHWAWLMGWPLLARLCLILLEVAAVYMAATFGMFAGLFIRFWLSV